MHTPGPWMFHGPRDNIHVCQESDPDMRVCFMTSNGPTRENARLISAAPDLLAGLIAIRDGTISGTVGGDDVVWFDQITTLHDFCDQLIAAATEPRP